MNTIYMYVYSYQPARFLLMNLLMHAIYYTYLIVIMLLYFLHYQNLSTEIKTPLNCFCYFLVISVWILSLLILIKLEWEVFKAWGLHFIHISINSLSLKIEELCHIACLSNAAVIGISESKLDNSIFNSEIEMDGYNLCFDRNTQRRGSTWHGNYFYRNIFA